MFPAEPAFVGGRRPVDRHTDPGHDTGAHHLRRHDRPDVYGARVFQAAGPGASVSDMSDDGSVSPLREQRTLLQSFSSFVYL